MHGMTKKDGILAFYEANRSKGRIFAVDHLNANFGYSRNYCLKVLAEYEKENSFDVKLILPPEAPAAVRRSSRSGAGRRRRTIPMEEEEDEEEDVAAEMDELPAPAATVSEVRSLDDDVSAPKGSLMTSLSHMEEPVGSNLALEDLFRIYGGEAVDLTMSNNMATVDNNTLDTPAAAAAAEAASSLNKQAAADFLNQMLMTSEDPTKLQKQHVSNAAGDHDVNVPATSNSDYSSIVQDSYIQSRKMIKSSFGDAAVPATPPIATMTIPAKVFYCHDESSTPQPVASLTLSKHGVIALSANADVLYSRVESEEGGFYRAFDVTVICRSRKNHEMDAE